MANIDEKKKNGEINFKKKDNKTTLTYNDQWIMTLSKTFLWGINLLLIVLLVSRVMIIDNDKSPIAYIIGFAALTCLNLLLWLILAILKVKLASQFKIVIIGFMVLFLPLLILVIYG